MSNIPVRTKDLLKLKVEEFGAAGNGIARVDGFVVFLRDSVEVGKSYMVEIEKVLPRFAFGRVISK